jgi:hypothetical protein
MQHAWNLRGDDKFTEGAMRKPANNNEPRPLAPTLTFATLVLLVLLPWAVLLGLLALGTDLL